MQATFRIVGTQFADGDSDTLEQTAHGTLTALPDGWRLAYVADDTPAVQTVLTVTDTRLTMTRSGAVSTEMVFECGRRHPCDYDTGFGILPLGMTAERVEHDLTATGGNLFFSYTMDQNGCAVSFHKVIVQVTCQ